MSDTLNSFLKLKNYCEFEDFKGWDPYDGLNSKIFQSLPLKNWYLSRLIWIQFFKISPINFRKFLLVPKEHNTKGIGLFLYGYCNLYEIANFDSRRFGSKSQILNMINYLADLLIKLQNKKYSGSCWGYNFDWQNRETFRKRYSPTVVATSFCGEALFKAYDITKNKKYLNCALSSCDFITKDLNRSYVDGTNFIFSYSPSDKSKVYNASLLGAKLLSLGYTYKKKEEWYDLAKISADTIVAKQDKDGSWIYGEHNVQNWKDSFHSGFNLECIWKVSKNLNDKTLINSFNKGMDYYLNNFFIDNEIPKYYNNKTYPIDIHCPAQLIITLSHTKLLKKNANLAKNVIFWTIKNMQSRKGPFFYQLKRGVSSKIYYMRWAQAWMFKALTEYIKFNLHENLD